MLYYNLLKLQKSKYLYSVKSYLPKNQCYNNVSKEIFNNYNNCSGCYYCNGSGWIAWKSNNNINSNNNNNNNNINSNKLLELIKQPTTILYTSCPKCQYNY
jgi:hypothetical protein